jgi:hypothetical protein
MKSTATHRWFEQLEGRRLMSGDALTTVDPADAPATDTPSGVYRIDSGIMDAADAPTTDTGLVIIVDDGGSDAGIHAEQLNNKYPENMKHEVREHVQVGETDDALGLLPYIEQDNLYTESPSASADRNDPMTAFCFKLIIEADTAQFDAEYSADGDDW